MSKVLAMLIVITITTLSTNPGVVNSDAREGMTAVCRSSLVVSIPLGSEILYYSAEDSCLTGTNATLVCVPADPLQSVDTFYSSDSEAVWGAKTSISYNVDSGEWENSEGVALDCSYKQNSH